MVKFNYFSQFLFTERVDWLNLCKAPYEEVHDSGGENGERENREKEVMIPLFSLTLPSPPHLPLLSAFDAAPLPLPRLFCVWEGANKEKEKREGREKKKKLISWKGAVMDRKTREEEEKEKDEYQERACMTLVALAKPVDQCKGVKRRSLGDIIKKVWNE